jgi:glycerol-3-phosphate acyltransferase PlsY
MPLAVSIVVSVLAAYALGSLPFGYWLGRLRGVDVTAVGSGNPGAGNVFRTVSPYLGIAVLALDLAKGAGAVLIGHALGLELGASFLPGAAALLGHWRSPFMGFRGGAGLATAGGAGLGVLPVPGGIGFGVWLFTTATTRNVGWAAGAGYAALLGVALVLDDSPKAIIAVMSLGALVAIRAYLWPSKPRGSQ